jgi:delta14-sterol reductase/lamin-B receptor
MTSVAPEASASLESVGKKAKKGDSTHFGGPWGARVLLVFLPLVSLYLWICIHRHEGALVVPDRSVFAAIPVPTPRSALLLLGWVGFQALLDVALPGKVVTGLAQRDGVKMQYRLNGFLSLLVTLAVGGGLYAAGLLRGAVVLEELGPLLSSAILFAFLFSLFLYFYGFTSTREEERTDLAVYDYFMGTALNPRLGKLFDLKLFFESKIGMTTWIVLSLAMAAAQFERDGSVSTEMILVCLFQLWYVADFYWFEDAMLTTWDINYENYGFMLAFGFIVWMPFNFSLQAQYLVYHRPNIPLWALGLIVVLNFVGYYVFRASNLQKHHFRTRPDAKIWGKAPEFIQTQRGTKLLTSGFWGLARHTNYMGDLMMALAWCLPAGFSHVPPYFYFIYFAPLLLDRERRDHKVCAKKYGADWETYCAKVKWRIVPYLY